MRAEALVLVVVWLMAANLRTVIFGVQPVLPDIRRDLGLSFGATGALTSAALAVLGLGSLPGALAGSRLGARRTVTWMTAGIGGAGQRRLQQRPAHGRDAFWPSAAAGVPMSVVGPLVPRAIAGRRAETAA